MRLIKLYTIVLLYLHKKSIAEKLTDYFSMPNDKDQGTKSLSNCLDVNNKEYHIFYETSSVENTVNCVAIKKNYLINFCNNEVNKQFPEFCINMYNRLSHTIYPEFKKPLNVPLMYRDLVVGGMVMISMLIYRKLVEKPSRNVNINNILMLEINNLTEMIEALLRKPVTVKLVCRMIGESSYYTKKLIEYYSTNINKVSNLTNAIDSFEEIKEQIAISNPQLVSELAMHANIYDENGQLTSRSLLS